jgi:FAD/FMN-containing dehydrogenase
MREFRLVSQRGSVRHGRWRMSQVQIADLKGQRKGIEVAAVEQLRLQLQGELLLPGDAGYDQARAIWNAMIDRRPALIARCQTSSDVQRAVAFAQENELLVSVRGGGHNIAGNAVCDGGLMIDLSPMNSVQVDQAARRAYVGPGATLGDFDREAQAFGLATPLGINSTTGVAGLTLGGGVGWLSRKYGMTVDSLVAADVVTADASLVRASEQENPDLFWAVRGGGGNFGIVTNFEFQLHPVGPEVLAGLLVFPYEQAKSLLTKYRDFTERMPEEMNVWVVLRKAPPLPFLPQEVHGKEIVVFAICYAGGIEQGQQAVRPLYDFGQVLGEHLGPMPYTAWQQAFDPLLTPGARNYWKSHNFTGLSDGLFDTTIEYAGKLPSPQCEIFIGLVGGQPNRVPTDATAYTQRDARFIMNVHGRWERPQDDQHVISWAREFFDKSAPYATGGVYVNFMTQEETGRVKAAYGSNYARLAQVKRKYDPANLFRMNQNVPPA